MIRYGLVIFGLVFAQPALALDEQAVLFLQNAVDAELESDLPAAIEMTATEFESQDLWRNALEIMRDGRLSQYERYSAVVRIMSAAVVLSGQTADNLPLTQLTRQDINAMMDAIGFPEQSDLIHYLLARGPSLGIIGVPGGYTAIRLSPEREPRQILERTDVPVLNLGPTFSSTELAPEDDPVHKPEVEYAKTRRANLSSIPPIILAAKSYRQASRAAQSDRPYAFLIALEALEEAVAANPSEMRLVGYNALIQAELSILKTAADAPLSPLLKEEQSRVSLKVPSTAFFARQFDEASKSYSELVLPEGDQGGHVWKLWGVAISRFGAGRDATADFEGFLEALDQTGRPFAEIAVRFFDWLPAADKEAFPDISAWREKAAAVAGTLTPDPRAAYRVDLDFVRIMETIARPDVAGPFLMSRIEATRGEPLETGYLRRLAAFVRDYCYIISFRISPYGAWIRRAGAGYDPMIDFLDSFHPSGRLTNSGEVVRPSPGKVPYPAINPEEDCAVILVASGIAEHVTIPGLTPRISADFENWVRQAFEREAPPPSLAPYLKLLVLDWFAFAFETLKSGQLPAADYRYRVLGSSDLATPAFAERLLTRDDFPPWQKATLELFLETHRFLTNRYAE